MRLLFSIIAVFVCISGFSQDKIMLMSGKVLEGKIVKADTSGVDYEFQKKEETKTIHIDDYRIYSYTIGEEKPVVVYQQDSLMGRTYTVDQMGAFIEGERVAMEQFNGIPAMVYTFLISGAAPYLLSGSIFAFPVPVILAFTTLIPRAKVNPDHVDNKDLLKEEYFLKGYQRVIKSKRLNRSIIAGLVGVGIGYGVNALVN